MKGTGVFTHSFFIGMFDIGDIVSVRTEVIDGERYGRNSLGGLFPVNREYYEILTDMGNGLYVIGIGGLAIAAVQAGTLRLEDAESAWIPVLVCGKVHVKPGAKNYIGYPLPSYVYEQEYDVIRVMCDRVVLCNGTQVIAVKGEDVL